MHTVSNHIKKQEWQNFNEFCHPKTRFSKKWSSQVLKMVSKLLKNKKDKTEEEADFERVLASSSDNSSRDYIKPLVEYVRGL